MAYEERGNRRYYYRKQRIDGKVVSEYIGSGWIADFAALTDGRECHERLMARLHLEDFKQEQARLDGAVGTYHDLVRNLVATVMQVAGFHQHKRQWRMKRQGEDRKMADELAVQARKKTFDEYNDLLRAASVAKPKKADLEKFEQYGIDHPSVFEGFSMLARTTLNELIGSVKANEATKIYVKGEVRALERSLGYGKSSPLEELLIKDIVLCWLRLHLFEQIYTTNYASGDGVSFAKAEYLEKRLSATRRRYHQAIEGLARTRALLARAGVQINIAQQQVVMNG